MLSISQEMSNNH